jgi:hypothetical protein
LTVQILAEQSELLYSREGHVLANAGQVLIVADHIPAKQSKYCQGRPYVIADAGQILVVAGQVLAD